MKQKQPRFAWGCMAVSSVLALGPAGTALAQTYPDPLPDFAHLDTPHGAFAMLTQCSTGTRRMLVIYRQFPDLVEQPPVGVEGVGAAFFGPFPSVAGYHSTASLGAMTVVPAPESGGTLNDGVVVVSNRSLAEYILFDDADGDGTVTETEKGSGQPVRNRDALDAADPFVDFSAFDDNGDDAIDGCELIVVHVASTAEQIKGDVGGRGVASGELLDGHAAPTFVAMSLTQAGLFAHTHEAGHVIYHVGRDFYGFGVGSFELFGAPPNYGSTQTQDNLFLPSAWTRLHLGWNPSTVVTRDGYYPVRRADTSGEMFLLYDPERGAEDYFLVENRQPGGAGSYDKDASDRGLVIWRIDDRQYESGSEAVRPLEIVRPDGQRTPGCGDNDLDGLVDEDTAADGVDEDGDGRDGEDPPTQCYGGSSMDAWDPADPATPQRTMELVTWADGTPSNMAVRAIGPSGDSIQAYFDVRGPGILVDLGPSPSPLLVPRGREAEMEMPIMNTGEASDSFDITLEGLPAGWSGRTARLDLGAQATTVALPALTAPRETPPGLYPALATAQSSTDAAVRTQLPVLVEVVNAPPVCQAGGPYVAECQGGQTPVTLDGSASSDADLDALSFSWSGPFAGGSAAGSPVVVAYPGTGSFSTSLTVNDGFDSAICLATVTVQDTAAPAIQAPADVAVECASPAGTPVALGNATAEDVCDATVVIANDAPALFPLGTTAVSWTAGDDSGNEGGDTQSVQVVDTVPPSLSVTLDVTLLTPPDHSLRPIQATVSTSDACDASPEVRLVSIVSSEPDNGLGDGDTEFDVAGAEPGTDDRAFALRSERSGGGPGRTYTITYRAEDASGNVTTQAVTVSVPH